MNNCIDGPRCFYCRPVFTADLLKKQSLASALRQRVGCSRPFDAASDDDCVPRSHVDTGSLDADKTVNFQSAS